MARNPRDRVDIIESSAQKTQLWLKDVQEELHGANRVQAYSALRAVLHALRDCLPMGEAIKFSAQMPLMIRGIYFDGYKPRTKPSRMTKTEFFAYLRDCLRNQTDIDPALATSAVLRTLYGHLSLGELKGIQLVLPREVRALWRELEPEADETSVVMVRRGGPGRRNVRLQRGMGRGVARQAAPAPRAGADAQRTERVPPPGAGA